MCVVYCFYRKAISILLFYFLMIMPGVKHNAAGYFSIRLHCNYTRNPSYCTITFSVFILREACVIFRIYAPLWVGWLIFMPCML